MLKKRFPEFAPPMMANSGKEPSLIETKDAATAFLFMRAPKVYL